MVEAKKKGVAQGKSGLGQRRDLLGYARPTEDEYLRFREMLYAKANDYVRLLVDIDDALEDARRLMDSYQLRMSGSIALSFRVTPENGFSYVRLVRFFLKPGTKSFVAMELTPRQVKALRVSKDWSEGHVNPGRPFFVVLRLVSDLIEFRKQVQGQAVGRGGMRTVASNLMSHYFAKMKKRLDRSLDEMTRARVKDWSLPEKDWGSRRAGR